jgi:hypothetical protein
MAKITVWSIAKAMVEAGIFTQDEINNTRRIVIDLDVHAMPVMYVERYLDKNFIQVVTTLKGIEISREEKPDGYNPGDSERGGSSNEAEDEEYAGGGAEGMSPGI